MYSKFEWINVSKVAPPWPAFRNANVNVNCGVKLAAFFYFRMGSWFVAAVLILYELAYGG